MRKSNVWILLIIIAICLSVWFIGYIPRYPIWVDDFSCLDDDELSRIIVNGTSDRPNDTGFSKLDSVKIRRFSDSVFVGRDKESVINTFNTYGCGCDVVHGSDSAEHLICKYRRQWNIRNDGAYHEDEGVAFWTKPIVVMVYDFCLEKTGLVKSIDRIKMIEATRHSTFNEKSTNINQ